MLRNTYVLLQTFSNFARWGAITEVSQAEKCPSSHSTVSQGRGRMARILSHSSSVLPLPWNTLSPAPQWPSTRHFSFFQSYSSKVQLIIIFVDLDHSTHGIKLLGLLVSTSPSPQAPLLPGRRAHSSKLEWAAPWSLVLSCQLLMTPSVSKCLLPVGFLPVSKALLMWHHPRCLAAFPTGTMSEFPCQFSLLLPRPLSSHICFAVYL